MASHLASPWNRGFGQLGNGLLSRKMSETNWSWEKINCVRQFGRSPFGCGIVPLEFLKGMEKRTRAKKAYTVRPYLFCYLIAVLPLFVCRPVVQGSISANPGLNFYFGFLFPSFKSTFSNFLFSFWNVQSSSYRQKNKLNLLVKFHNWIRISHYSWVILSQLWTTRHWI